MINPENKEINYEELEEGERILAINVRQGIQLRAFQTKSSKLAERASKDTPKKTFDSSVPKCYHEFECVFTKEAFDEISPRNRASARSRNNGL